MSLIDVQNLKKVYTNEEVETPALSGVSFAIEKGEFVAMMGPSGSGKSTLLHVLGLLDRQTSGTYRFDGKVLEEYTEIERAHMRNTEMGFVFQSFNLLARTTVLNNVLLPLQYSDVPESQWRGLAEKSIDLVGLSHRIHHYSSQLSGGEKQRVAIARALVRNPQVIFADEPTGNLDSASGGQVMALFEQLHGLGHTIILITHETYTAAYAERTIAMRDGKIERDQKTAKRRTSDDGFIK